MCLLKVVLDVAESTSRKAMTISSPTSRDGSIHELCFLGLWGSCLHRHEKVPFSTDLALTWPDPERPWFPSLTREALPGRKHCQEGRPEVRLDSILINPSPSCNYNMLLQRLRYWRSILIDLV